MWVIRCSQRPSESLIWWHTAQVIRAAELVLIRSVTPHSMGNSIPLALHFPMILVRTALVSTQSKAQIN
jgi:hypothetical protein